MRACVLGALMGRSWESLGNFRDGPLRYRFDEFTLDLGAGELRGADAVVAADQMTFSVLAYLVENADRLISKDELIEKVWNGRFVSDAAISSAIKSVRRALGDSGSEQRFVRTVHGRGFRFVEAVRLDVAPVAKVAAPLAHPDFDLARPTDDRPSIAVLPFTPIGFSGVYGAIADAVPAELISTLSRLRWLKVIARGSSFRFRSDAPDFENIGAALGVGYILSGSVELFAPDIALSIELNDARNGHVVWAERLSGRLEEIHQLRENVVGLVTAVLEMQIARNEAELARLRGPEGFDAWALFHTGLQHMCRFNQSDNALADVYFGRSLELDPGFARAHGARSFTSFQAAFLRYGSDRDRAIDDARRHAEAGLAIDPDDPFVNFNFGRSHWLVGDPGAGQGWIDRATSLSPSFAQGHYAHAWADIMAGKGARALADVQKAMTLSPLDPFRYAMEAAMGLAHFHVGNLDAAADWCVRGAGKPGAHYLIAAVAVAICEAAGKREEACYWAKQTRARRPDASIDQFFAAFPFEDQDRRQAMHQALLAHGFSENG